MTSSTQFMASSTQCVVLLFVAISLLFPVCWAQKLVVHDLVLISSNIGCPFQPKWAATVGWCQLSVKGAHTSCDVVSQNSTSRYASENSPPYRLNNISRQKLFSFSCFVFLQMILSPSLVLSLSTSIPLPLPPNYPTTLRMHTHTHAHRVLLIAVSLKWKRERESFRSCAVALPFVTETLPFSSDFRSCLSSRAITSYGRCRGWYCLRCSSQVRFQVFGSCRGKYKSGYTCRHSVFTGSKAETVHIIDLDKICTPLEKVVLCVCVCVCAGVCLPTQAF